MKIKDKKDTIEKLLYKIFFIKPKKKRKRKV